MKAEVTIMVVQVNEFRKGTKIGELRREMEVIVIACTSNNPPSITTPQNVRSKSVCAGDTVSLDFSTSDPNANDIVTISWDHTIPGASWTDSNGLTKHPSAKLTWVPTNKYVSSLPYTFTVTAKDNACPIPASYTQSYQITVKPIPEAKITVVDSGCGNYWFHAQRINGSGPFYLWQSPLFAFTPDNGSVTQHKFQPGLYPYSMTITTSGCSKTYFDTVSVTAGPFLSVSLPADTAICPGSSLSITPNIQFAKGKVKYHWSNGDTNRILHFGPVTKDELITLTVEETNGCNSTDSILVSMKLKIIPEKPVDVCYTGNFNVKINPVYHVLGSNNYVTGFNWHKLGDTSTLSNLSELNTKDTGVFEFTITDNSGCSASELFSIINSKTPKISINDIDICYNSNNKYQVNVVPVYQLYGSNNYVNSFKWQKLGDTTILSDTNFLNTRDTGVFEFAITDKFGCSATKSFAVLNSINKPQILMNDKVLISQCNISPITITPTCKVFGNNNFISAYKWQQVGDTSILSNQLKLITKDTGLYNLTIADKFGCEATDSIKVELTPKIDTSLQLIGSTLTAAPGLWIYKWYKNDTLIYAGATNVLKVLQNGNYFVMLYDYYGCIDISRTIKIKLVSISNDRLNDPVKLYPNPNSGKLMLEINQPVSGDINLSLINIYGRVILNQTFKAKDLRTVKEIDISDQPAGTYTVIIRYKNANFHQLIIKE